MTTTPRERLESLLKIHKGCCFVPESANDFVGLMGAANEMETEKQVSITLNLAGVRGIRVIRKGWRGGRFSQDEVENQTY